MRFGFNTFNHSTLLGLPPTLPAQIRAAAKAGYDAVGPDYPSVKAHVDGGGRLEDLANEMERAGVACAELSPLGITANPQRSLASFEAILEAAEILRPESVQVVVDGSEDDPKIIDALRRATNELGERGIGLAVEFLPTRVVNCIGQVLALRTATAADVRVMVDTWHFFEGPDDFASLEALPLDALGFVQFDDAVPKESDDLSAELMNRRAMPGEGVLDLRRFCDTLLAKGFDGLVSVEVLSAAWRNRPIEEFTERTLAASKPYWER